MAIGLDPSLAGYRNIQNSGAEGATATASTGRKNAVDDMAALTSAGIICGVNDAAEGSEQPVLTSPSGNVSPSLDWVGVLPSPQAAIMALIVQDAAEQRRINREDIQATGAAAADKMDDQADEIMSGAVAKFACAVAGSIASMAVAGIAMGKLTNGLVKMNAGPTGSTPGGMQVLATQATTINAFGGSLSSLVSSGGDLAQGASSAETKRLEADQQRLQTMMEQTKQLNDSLRDLVSKSLDCMNALQSGANQTRAKILG